MAVNFSYSNGCFTITDTVAGIVHSGNNPVSFSINDNKIDVTISNLGGSGNARLFGSYALSDINQIGGIAVSGTLLGALGQLNTLIGEPVEVNGTISTGLSQPLTDSQLRANPVGVLPSMASGGNLSVTTAVVGTNWTAFGSQVCKQLTISNQSGTTIEVRQGAAGVGFQIPTGTFYTFFGITNANQLDVRRVDTSNTQITITARWEA